MWQSTQDSDANRISVCPVNVLNELLLSLPLSCNAAHHRCAIKSEGKTECKTAVTVHIHDVLFFDPPHRHHVAEGGGDFVIGSAVDDGVRSSAVDAEPDSARVISSAKRNRSSNAARSCIALSCAAAASSWDAGVEAPYAHEPATTAARVRPCATIRTRSQLLKECD